MQEKNRISRRRYKLIYSYLEYEYINLFIMIKFDNRKIEMRIFNTF